MKCEEIPTQLKPKKSDSKKSSDNWSKKIFDLIKRVDNFRGKKMFILLLLILGRLLRLNVSFLFHSNHINKAHPVFSLTIQLVVCFLFFSSPKTIFNSKL